MLRSTATHGGRAVSKSDVLLVATLLCFGASALHATEPLAGEQLKTYCKEWRSNGDDALANACSLYISGFLDGATTTDPRVAENVAEEINRQETFSERAIRTRVSRRLVNAGPTAYAGFCVDAEVPVSEVITDVVHALDAQESLSGVEAQTIVYAALRENYPCRPMQRE